MKKILLTMAFVLFVSAAQAGQDDWSVQVRWGFGQMFPLSDEWEELYANDDIPRENFALDAVLWKGFGPYFGYQGGKTKSTYLEKIDLTFQSHDLVFGGQYRYPLYDRLVPGLRLGLLWIKSKEVLDDDYIKYEMESETLGFEIAQDWNVYFAPNARSHFWRGWGAYAEYYYQYRPVKDMGDLKDTSGFGYHLGIQYRFEFKAPKRRRKKGSSIEELQMRPKEENGKIDEEKPGETMEETGEPANGESDETPPAPDRGEE